MVNEQLCLLDTPAELPYWKLDSHTIEIGRAGLARARAILAQASGAHAFERRRSARDEN